MVRQRPRKSVEELYASKLESGTAKSAMSASNHAKQTGRHERDYGNYIISSTTPYSATCASGGMQTTRRKTSRTQPVKVDKYSVKEEKGHLEDAKKEANLKSKTARIEKGGTFTNSNAVGSTIFDSNKNYGNNADPCQKDHHHHNHHGRHQHDDDKDDDTEEFFELIRQTVENAIGKSISELLNRNFRELSAKIDRFSSELKSTNSHLNKLQSDINNKVVHYGEENSRHFRYLCMKSEYDKMFYQHHTMLASKGAASLSHGEKRSRSKKGSGMSGGEGDKQMNSCACSNSRKSVEVHKSSSEEQSVSQKSSDMGMREVLDQIQRFCTQMQMNDLKCDERQPKSNYRSDEAMKKQVFEVDDDDDDDDFPLSSDGMTPRSDEHVSHNYGNTTMRSCSTTRGANGGGDA